MSLTPLLEAPWVIQIHAFAAAAALLLGAYQIVAPKGTLPHRSVGVLWLLLMSAIAVSSVFIRPSLYPGLPMSQWFSFIHVFTIMTVLGLISGTLYLLRGGAGLKRHKGPFIGIFLGGLIVAGAFAFLPGRIMHDVVFGS